MTWAVWLTVLSEAQVWQDTCPQVLALEEPQSRVAPIFFFF